MVLACLQHWKVPQKKKKDKNKKGAGARALAGTCLAPIFVVGCSAPDQMALEECALCFSACFSRVGKTSLWQHGPASSLFSTSKPGGVTSLCARLRSALLFDPPLF